MKPQYVTSLMENPYRWVDWIPGVWDTAVNVVNEVEVEVVALTLDLVLEGLHLAGLLDQDNLIGRVAVDADAW